MSVASKRPLSRTSSLDLFEQSAVRGRFAADSIDRDQWPLFFCAVKKGLPASSRGHKPRETVVERYGLSGVAVAGALATAARFFARNASIRP